MGVSMTDIAREANYSDVRPWAPASNAGVGPYCLIQPATGSVAKEGRACAAQIIHPTASIFGTVECSLIGPNTVVAEWAVVRNSVVIANSYVGRGALVDTAVLKESAWVGSGAFVGCPAQVEGGTLSGITVVERAAVVPPGAVVRSGARVGRVGRVWRRAISSISNGICR